MSEDISVLQSSGSPLGMGWTITGFFSIGTFFVGVVMILVAFTVLNAYSQYRNNIDSKLPLLIVAWVGFALFTLALFFTYGRFTMVVKKMNASKFFAKEGFQNTAAALEANLREIEKLRTRFELAQKPL